MNHRQQVAAMHARELAQAKQQLLLKVNQYIQEVRAEGGTAEVTPQIQRLIELDKYRLRDVQRMQQLASDPQKVQEYVYAENAQGVPISGEKAIERYASYATSSIYREPTKPARQEEVMLDNTAETVAQSFVDLKAYGEFEQFLTNVIQSPTTAIDESWWRTMHVDWDAPDYRGDRDHGKEKMVEENRQNIYEMRAALQALVTREGVQAVAQRINDNYTELQEASIIAAIGYAGNAASALQTVLKIFMPDDRQPGVIRHRMSDMQDVIEGQFNYDNEE
nr:MAG TPA: hypothetical protein [Caudoviricetes sp.]